MPPVYVQVDLGGGATRVHTYPDDSAQVCVQHPVSKQHSAKAAAEIVVGDYLCTYPPSNQPPGPGYEVTYVGAAHPDEE